MNKQRIALITGANQGIGFQIAKELVAKGLTVLVGSRNLEKGEAAAKSKGGTARAIQLDVTDQNSIDAATKLIDKEYGHLDILVNNAAISNTRATPDMKLAEYFKISMASNASLDEMRAVWETNVFGVMAVTQALLPLLRKAPFANIVNVSSGMGSLTANCDPSTEYRKMFGPIYPASKTALNAITVAFANELEESTIKVNAVTPGFTKTALNNFEGIETLEQGAAEAVRVALLGADGPTGKFTATQGELPW
jgi:NAD(P)-dependent dehydrogenase (short-subunit alcohol dehydrogenase family)